MNLLAWNRTTLALAAALATMVAFPGGADAFWASSGSYGSYGSRGSSGSSGSYGSSGSSGSYGSYGSRGSYASSGGSYASSGGSYASSGGSHGPGPIKRLVMHIHAKKASRASSGGSSGSYGSSSHSSGSHGSSGGSSGGVTYYHSSAGSTGSHGSSGGSSGSTGSYGGYSSVTTHSHVIASTPTVTRVVAAKPVAPAVTGSGTLRVSVPADATVYVNDRKTTSTGSQRQYVSNGLKQGQSYTYRVRVEYERNGKTVTESKVASLTLGSDETLAFDASSPAPAAVLADEDDAEEADEAEVASKQAITKLALRVPADAKVTLAGAATKQTGAEREFITTRLEAGATWEDYTVRVEAKVDGEPVVQQRRITLRGGESQAMVFNFESAKLASLD